MTPFSSVAILEKLALLKIAFCKAPVFSRASSRRTSATISTAAGSPSGIGVCSIFVPFLICDWPCLGFSLAVRFQEVDPEVSILKQESALVLNWSALVAQGQEQWPIAFLMPSGALITTK